MHAIAISPLCGTCSRGWPAASTLLRAIGPPQLAQPGQPDAALPEDREDSAVPAGRGGQESARLGPAERSGVHGDDEWLFPKLLA